MRILAAGVPPALTAHLRKTLPGLAVDTTTSLECLQALQGESYSLLILGADTVAARDDVLYVVRDVFDAQTLPIIYLLPPHLDAEKTLKAVSRLNLQYILMQPFDADDLAEKVSTTLKVPIPPAPVAVPMARRHSSGSLVPRSWKDQQAGLGPRLDLLERAARALDAGVLSVPLARSGTYEIERLRRFLSENGHQQGVQLLALLTPLFSGESRSRPAAPLVDTLRLLLVEPPGPARPLVRELAASAPILGRLLIVDADACVVQALVTDAEARHFDVQTAVDLAEATRVVQRFQPDVAIIDPATAAWAHLDAFFAELRACTPPVATLLLTGDSTLEARVTGCHLGASLFLNKPRSASEVMTLAEELLGLSRPAPFHILIVDDDAVTLDAIRAILEENRLLCTTLSDAVQFWTTLEEVRPDMLVLDISMPGVDGLELCRVVRNDPRWRWLPIMFLTGYTDPSMLEAVYEVGADDFATKPIAPEDFVTRLRNRLGRQHAVRVSEHVDALTGVGGRGRAIERFGQFVALAERDQVPLCLAVLNLDLFGDLNAVLGYETGDAILRHMARFLEAHLPADTLLARWSGDRFVLGFYAQSHAAVATILSQVLEQVLMESFATIDERPLQVSFSGGIAEYPYDGTNFLDLHRSATTLVAEAKVRGRRQVLSSAWFEDPEFMARPMDLVMVHPDEALASQVLTALGVRGYRGFWIGDSASILSRLLDAATRKPSLVVVWDLDMPDLDSWAMLHLLQSSLSQARLLILCAAPETAIMEEAGRLGAETVLTSPLHFAELLLYIRHALETSMPSRPVEAPL